MADAPLKDKDYDLVSTVYHASQGAQISRQYARDARETGDEEAAAFFESVRQEYAALAERGKQLLKQRL